MTVTLIKSSLDGITSLFTWKTLLHNHSFLDKKWQSYNIYTSSFDPNCDFKTRREAIQHLKKTTKYQKINDIDKENDVYTFPKSIRYLDCYEIEII